MYTVLLSVTLLYYRGFTECYDMQPHSTKVYGDMVDGIAGFIQSSFAQMSQSGGTTPTTPTSHNGISDDNVHVFVFRSGVIQHEVLPSSASQKPLLWVSYTYNVVVYGVVYLKVDDYMLWLFCFKTLNLHIKN